MESIEVGQSAVVILENTPFYAESGGQIGDSGYLSTQGVTFNVKDTQKYGQVFGHIGELTQGSLKVGQSVNAIVDAKRRHNTSLNHSATHLLHAALRQILGLRCAKGSLVSDKALRFDFAQPEAITKEQLSEIETLVNQKSALTFQFKRILWILIPQKRKEQWLSLAKNMAIRFVY